MGLTWDKSNLAQSYYELGIEKGLQKGIKEGIKEGVIKTARKALMRGMSIENVMELTDLTKEEVLKIWREIKN
ncbi:hypothetical protein M1N67_04025 [Peptococcaceae bacterium]|jgi:predicted transposase/invertase (TIGR01784 family)|nr:hypothetical protein [Peptococcaceae bacterium]MCL0068073.1 hypothetical protein [Peptococcaceae bacterium]MCL0072031.1 hypothetical protein [Peptococcaceae bacterium]